MELPIFNTYMNFSRHHFFCLQHPCFKKLCKIAQASKNSDSNAQHFLSDLLTHSWFHSMLFALPSYQFPYIAMNRCLYLRGSRDYYSIIDIMQRNNNKHFLISSIIYLHSTGMSYKVPQLVLSYQRSASRWSEGEEPAHGWMKIIHMYREIGSRRERTLEGWDFFLTGQPYGSKSLGWGCF